jgi:hypothetical protein
MAYAHRCMLIDILRLSPAPLRPRLPLPLTRAALSCEQKIDTDIIFKLPAPSSLFIDAARRKCIFAHTRIEQAWPNCQARSNDAMDAYASLRGIIPRSGEREWCRDESLYFYGNFVFGYAGMLRSAENLDYMTYLFDEWKDGLYKHRWTDQAIWPKIVCMWTDVEEVMENESVCDYGKWRSWIFKHV